MTPGSAPVALMDYLRLAAGYLDKQGSASARLDAEVLLSHVLGMDRMSLYVNFDRPLVPEEVTRFRQAVRRRGRGEPVAYIIGQREFRDMTLAVSPAVLIPRPETELLVEATLQALRGAPCDDVGEDVAAPRGPVIADVGTGSGAIAISLASSLADAALAAVDVSAAALAVARQNAEAYGVADRIDFIEGDLLQPLLSGSRANTYRGRLDAVVSNPPYISSEEWDALPRDVSRYEPRIALDGGPDGLSFYRRLVPQAAQAVRSGGLTALEIGAEQGASVVDLFTASGVWRDVRVLKDYAGRDRVVVARKGL